jgi:hypothetical protein
MKSALMPLILSVAACLPPGTSSPSPWGAGGGGGAAGVGGGAGAAPAYAGGATSTGGGFDLVYSVPAGFTETRGDQAITLGYATSDGYSNVSYTLIILPSQPIAGSLSASFHEMWAATITPLFTPTYTTGIQPAPLRRRLASGYAVAFDGELMNANNGGMFTTVLYLLSSGERVVPILGMFGDLDARNGEPIISAFLESASIAGSPPTSVPLFDASELVGEWSTQASEFANYVDSSGRYVGDANIAVRQDHTFDGDGSYAAYASAYQSDRGFDRESGAGTWRVDDDSVVLDTSSGTKRYRIFAVGTYRGVQSIYLPPSYAETSVAEFTRPRSLGDWYGRVR